MYLTKNFNEIKIWITWQTVAWKISYYPMDGLVVPSAEACACPPPPPAPPAPPPPAQSAIVQVKAGI